MADAIGSLFIDLSMQTASFDAATKRVEAQVKGLSSKISSGFSALKGTLAATGLVVAAQQIGAWAQSMAAAGEEAENLATSLGLSLAQVVQLQGVFQLTTGSLGEATAAFKAMNSAVQEARGGSESAIANFKALGISVADLNKAGSSQLEQLNLLADAWTNYEDSAEKSAIFADILGKGFAKLLPVLSGGRDAVKRYTDEFNRLNPAAEEAAKKGAELDSEIDKTTVSIQGVVNQGFVILQPHLIEAAQGMRDFAVSLRQTITDGNGLIPPLARIVELMQEASKWSDFFTRDLPGQMAQETRWRLGLSSAHRPGESGTVATAAIPMVLPEVKVTGTRGKVGVPKKGGGGGGGESEAVKEWKESVELMKEMAEEAKDASIAMAEGMQDVGDEVFRRRVLQIKNLLDLEKITGREAVDAERQVVEEKWAAHQEFYAKKREAAEGDKKEIARINREEATERERHLTELEQLEHEKRKQRFDQMSEWARDFGNVLENSFSNAFDGLTEGTFKFRNAIAGLLKDLGRMVASKGFQLLLHGDTKGGGGGLLGSLFGMFLGGGAKMGGGTGPFGDGRSAAELGIPGFAHGGSFRVGGTGTIDNQLYAFRPGEHVTVTPPGQGGGVGEPISISLATDWPLIDGRIDQKIVTASGQIVRVSVAQSTKAVTRNFRGISAEAQAREL